MVWLVYMWRLAQRHAMRMRVARCVVSCRFAGLFALLFGLWAQSAGCQDGKNTDWLGRPITEDALATPTTAPASEPGPTAASDPKNPASAKATDLSARPVPIEATNASTSVSIQVLTVRVPKGKASTIHDLWPHLREDIFDAETARRLSDNGFRVGIGRADWWSSIQSSLNAIEGVRSEMTPAFPLPANWPLALEIDTKPIDRTLFVVGDDGVVSGETWQTCRAVLKISYTPNWRDTSLIRLSAIPEVRQKLPGTQYVRNGDQIREEPRYTGRTFPLARFQADLRPGEFLLIAPSQRATVFGLIGGVLLTSVEDDSAFDALLFIRAEFARGD